VARVDPTGLDQVAPDWITTLPSTTTNETWYKNSDNDWDLGGPTVITSLPDVPEASAAPTPTYDLMGVEIDKSVDTSAMDAADFRNQYPELAKIKDDNARQEATLNFLSVAQMLIDPELLGAKAPEEAAWMGRLPEYAGGKTNGIIVSGDNWMDLVSGYDGPSAEMPKGTPGMNGNIKSHVEAHGAATMRTMGWSDATLYINNVPCAGGNGCGMMLSRMIPEGGSLRVIGPGGYNELFVNPFAGIGPR
jgi:hypothetical protein